MISPRSFGRIAAVAGALVLALPALAGTLAPQLKTLSENYHKAPQATVARLAQATGTAGGSLLLGPQVSKAGLVQVYLHYRSLEALPPATLDQLGASDVRVSRPLGVVQAWIPISKLRQAAALDGVTRVTLPIYAYVKASGTRPAADSCSPVQAGLAIDNEGIAAENIGPAQAAGATGSGVKVGIISTGVDCRSVSQAQGYLPKISIVDSKLSGSGDEGTAMLEEVHAVAPDATLGFCGYPTNGNPFSTVDFLQCLDDFAGWGANIISDDIGFFPAAYNFPLFPAKDGGNAITEFAEAHPDITLTTAAGNDGYDYYEGNYKADSSPQSPGGPPISLNPTYTIGGPFKQYEASNRSYSSAMNFGAEVGKPSDAALQVTIDPGITFSGDLTWNDPAKGPYDDLDLFLLKQDGSLACQPNGTTQWCSSTVDQMTYAGGKTAFPPFEYISYKNNTSSNQTLYLVALCYDCAAHGNNPLHVKVYGFMNGGGIFNYVTFGSIYGHSALADEFTIAAAKYNGSGVSSTIENYSSTGPYAYGDWSSGTKTRAKPDVTGTDCITVSGAGGFGSPFCGTSAASPNVGAVIALLRGLAPNAKPNAAGWKQLVMNTANPNALTSYIAYAGGKGLVDAAAAASRITPSNITATITAPAKSPFSVDPDTNVQFAATCNYQGSGTPQYQYQWTFGGNSGIPNSTKLKPNPVQYANGGVYTVTFTCSAKGESGSDSVTAEVQAAASAESQSLNTGHNQTLTGQLKGTGIGGEQVSYKLVKNAIHGTVNIASDGGFTYTPDKGFSGMDSFQFQIDNGVKKSNTATVTIKVAKGSPPTASDGTLTVKENQSASGTLQATDPDGDPLTFSIVSQPAHGKVTINNASQGSYTYTPDHGYSGSDNFAFKASNNAGDSNTAKVSITVQKVSSGGGGAFGGLALGLLAALAFILRRKR